MRVILCHGCFDVLHIGHVQHLLEARRLGGKLVVSITAAEFIKKKNRPIFNDAERARMLSELRCVDEVYVCHDATGAPAILKYKPAFYVKGRDYLGLSLNALETVACAKTGAQIVFTKTEKYSSTEVIRRVSCGL